MIPNRNCGERGRDLYEHEHEREGEGEARARMLIVGLWSIEAKIALLVTRGYGGGRERESGQGKLTMAFPRAVSTDHDPCPLHMERLSFDVWRCKTPFLCLNSCALQYHLVFFSGRQKYIYTRFGTEMSQIIH